MFLSRTARVLGVGGGMAATAAALAPQREHEQTAQASNTETAQWRAGPSVAQSEGVNPIIYAGGAAAIGGVAWYLFGGSASNSADDAVNVDVVSNASAGVAPADGEAETAAVEEEASTGAATPTKKGSVFDRRKRKLDRRQKGRDDARKKMFDDGDKDGDGMLDLSEAKALGMTEEMFHAIDVDGSGKLTDAEVAAWQTLNGDAEK